MIALLKIAQDLINELESESLAQRWRAEGVRLLYERIQHESVQAAATAKAAAATEANKGSSDGTGQEIVIEGNVDSGTQKVEEPVGT